LEDPVGALPVTARSILAAARRVLRERGFEGLTIEAVAHEANVSRTSISYHFDSRAGLVQAIIDSLFHDVVVRVWRRHRQTGRRGSLDDFVDMACAEADDVETEAEWFELMVCATRDEMIRRRVAELFMHYRRLDVEIAGVVTGDEVGSHSDKTGLNDAAQHDALGVVMQAVIDGISLQKVMDPSVDVQAAVVLFAELVRPALERASPAA
jgi:TetR/AcrR family transcriptional repressor of bet genes